MLTQAQHPAGFRKNLPSHQLCEQLLLGHKASGSTQSTFEAVSIFSRLELFSEA